MMESTLSVPSITSLYEGSYTLTWDEGVTVKIDDIYEHRNGGLEADVEIIDEMQVGASHILGPVRTAIDKTWTAVIKELETRNQRTDWRQRLTQVTKMVKENYKKGDPIQSLGKIPTPEPIHEPLSGLIWDNSPTLIYGPGGIGKSILGLAIGSALHNGSFFADKKASQKNCLYLDWETSIDQTYWRNLELVKGSNNVEWSDDLSVQENLDWPDPSCFDSQRSRLVFYRYQKQALQNDIKSLRRQIQDFNIGFLVIDSAGPAVGGEPESASSTIKLFEAIRAISPEPNKPLPSLILAHVSHDKMGKTGAGSSPFGSVFWMNEPRNIFELQGASYIENAKNITDYAFHHRKGNMGPLLNNPALGISLDWRSGNGVTIVQKDTKNNLALLSKAPLLMQAETWIQRDGPQTLNELVEKINPSNANVLSSSLAQSPKFQSVQIVDEDGKKGNRWSLKNPVNEDAEDSLF